MAQPKSESKSEVKPASGQADQLVYPVRFNGYHGVDEVSGLKTFTTTYRHTDGVRWQSHDIQDMRRYKREIERNPRAAKPQVHGSKAVRYFYNQEDADQYADLQGFEVLSPMKRSKAPDTAAKRPLPKPEVTGRDTTTRSLRSRDAKSHDTKGRVMTDESSGGDDVLEEPDGPTTTGLADTSSPTVPPEVAEEEGMSTEEVREVEGDVGKADASGKRTKGKKK